MILIPPTETQLEFIKKDECYQSPEVLEQDVTQLIEWMSKQQHLPNITDRKWLLHFIVGCKYSLQRAKQVIEAYFVSRAEFPEFFGSYTKELIAHDTKFEKFSIFPKRTPEGYRVMCVRYFPPPDVNDDGFDGKMFGKFVLTGFDLQLKEEPMYGNIVIIDKKNFTLSRFLSLTPTLSKTIAKCCLSSFPIRVKAIHYVNPPKFMSRAMAFVKMFVSNKMKDRMFVHETLEDLHKYIPKDVLPEEYGGTCGSIEKLEADFVDFLIANQEWIATRQIADLSKRPDHLKGDELDMNGTFKKLEID